MNPATDPRVQEALSRRYSNDIIMLLPLRDGSIAVFNAARELCGFVPARWADLSEIERIWHPPAPAPTTHKSPVDLNDLELL
jgi:hypothetical protein